MVTLEQVAEVVNATYGFTPKIYDHCVCFQLCSESGFVDVVLSVETATDDEELHQAVRIGFYFVNEKGPLDFSQQGLANTLVFLHNLGRLTSWGSLKAYEGENGLEVFLYHITKVTESEIKNFCAGSGSCALADAFVFLTEEWSELKGILAKFACGEVVTTKDVELLAAFPAGYA